MDCTIGEYELSGERGRIDAGRVIALLHGTYWAAERRREAILRSLDHSLCFGVYLRGEQVGFARVITDYATIFWMCDVVIDEAHRGRGLGRALVGFVLGAEPLRGLNAFIATRDAFTLYEKFGFVKSDYFMYRPGVPHQPSCCVSAGNG